MRRKPLSLVLSAVAVAAAAVGVSLVAPSASAAVGDFNFSQPQTAASGLAVPWGMAFLPDGSALVSERDSARLLQIRPGSTPTVVATVGGVVPGGEGGLLGIAVSPTFATDNLVYAYYTAASENRIVRFRLDNPANQQAVLTGLAKANFHNSNINFLFGKIIECHCHSYFKKTGLYLFNEWFYLFSKGNYKFF